MQSEAGKALPFLFVVNLQVPGPPWYSLVAYFASDRPIRAQPQSLLHRFYSSADDSFRNARFKLIPRIAEVTRGLLQMLPPPEAGPIFPRACAYRLPAPALVSDSLTSFPSSLAVALQQ